MSSLLKFETNRLSSFDCINKQIIIEKDLYKLDTNFAPEIVLENSLMADNWEKYIKDLKKNLSY